MSDIETRREEIAKRYGGVLFDLAQENKALKTVLKEVRLLRESLQKIPHEWSRLISPNVPVQDQRQVVESLAVTLKFGHLMTRFLVIVCQNRRLQNLISILDAFMIRSRVAEGIVDGVIETPTELSKKEMEELQKSLKAQLGKEVSLRQDIKKNLLAGVVLRIGSVMIDASLAMRLNKLRYGTRG